MYNGLGMVGEMTGALTAFPVSRPGISVSRLVFPATAAGLPVGGAGVLPFMPGGMPEADGMLRTGVVAGQAARAVSEPLGASVGPVPDVPYGAVGAARVAAVARRLRVEIAVGDKQPVEQRPEHARLHPGHAAGGDAADAPVGGKDVGCDGVERRAGCVELPVGDGFAVDVEAREADIGVRHLYGEDGVQGHSFRL